MREYTNKLLALVDEGVLDARAVLENALGYMSEDEVKDFCQSEYAEQFEEDEEEEEEEEEEVVDEGGEGEFGDLSVYYDAADLYDERDE